MYLGIDIGGTKTLVACLDGRGNITESNKFPTPKEYPLLREKIAKTVEHFSTKHYAAVGIGVPGRINRARGIALAFGTLPWKQVHIKSDFQRMFGCPIVVENDANLAALSEAMLVKQYRKVLYITIGTGIGTGIVTGQSLAPEFLDAEGGQILLEHDGKLQRWEDFASGQGIQKRFGKPAKQITDEKTWHIIAKDIALGLIDLVTMVQPDIIIVGGGVSTNFEHFHVPLERAMAQLATPLSPVPPIVCAQRPNEAVIYGCYDLAKSIYGRTD
jgi:predicted NBD/HSP70 family sugar kinase